MADALSPEKVQSSRDQGVPPDCTAHEVPLFCHFHHFVKISETQREFNSEKQWDDKVLRMGVP